jgi:hypothetical protein
LALVTLLAFSWIAGEKANQATESRQMMAAQREKAQAEALLAKRDAEVLVIKARSDEQVHIRDANRTAIWRPAHLDPRLYVNGLPSLPSPFEMAAWGRWNLPMGPTTSSSTPVLPAPEMVLQHPLPNHVDLVNYLYGIPSLRRLFLGVGRFPEGEVKPIYASLERLVHIACAGSSGFGKSSFLIAVGHQILQAREQVTPVMMDTQGITFTPFEGNSRLCYPLVSSETDIELVLGELVGEMTRRAGLFSQFRGCAKLTQYNELVAPEDRLPIIPVFFDEFGLVSDNKAISAHIKKLVQGGRKCGLYLVAGAQTWLASDISTAIRSNLATSVQFHARDKSQSRQLLGDGAAATITEPGRAFAILPGQAGLIELQAPDPSNALQEIIPEPLSEPPLNPVPTRTETEEEAQDRLFRELVEAGNSRNAAAQQAYGRSYAGNLVERGKRALGEL